jgi:hypothetical protein
MADIHGLRVVVDNRDNTVIVSSHIEHGEFLGNIVSRAERLLQFHIIICYQIENFAQCVYASEHITAPFMQQRFAQNSLHNKFFALVAPTLQRGDGLPLLGLLREIGLDKTAFPLMLMLALEAAIGNDPERLSDVEPEVRTAALKMLERLGNPASES